MNNSILKGSLKCQNILAELRGQKTLKTLVILSIFYKIVKRVYVVLFMRTKTFTKGWHLIFSLDDLITVPMARFRQGTKAVFLVQLFINHLSAYVFVHFCPKFFM